MAVPFSFSANGAAGMFPALVNQNDFVAMTQATAGMLLGKALAPGLDVAGFRMTDQVSDASTVAGAVSWVAAAVDLVVALGTALLPQARVTTTTYRTLLTTVHQRLAAEISGGTLTITASRSLSILQTVVKETKVSPTVAGQATFLLDTINCATAAGDGISKVRDWATAGNAIVGIARQCLSQIAAKMRINELKHAVEALHEIAGIAKVVPEIGQLAAMGILELLGQDATHVTFTVRKGTPTRVVTLVGMTKAGEPASDFTVAASDDTNDNVSYCDQSPAATGPGVVRCSPSAAGADVCWVQPNRINLLCGGNPSEKTLRQLTSDEPVAPTTVIDDPAPWGLELSNGLQCRLRNGGAWGGRADNYVGAVRRIAQPAAAGRTGGRPADRLGGEPWPAHRPCPGGQGPGAGSVRRR